MNIKRLPDKQYLVTKVGKKKDLPNLKKTSAEVISLYTDDGVDIGGGGGGTSDFEDLTNRPKYNGSTMTGDTNIPEVKTYTAGDNVEISSDGEISATDTTYTAGENISIENGEISATDTTYTAGENISISDENVISVTGGGTTYTAGDNIDISDENVISATDTTYSAGSGISISDENVISATGGGGGSSVITGSGAPTKTTVGTLGQNYLDTSTGDYYVCSNIETDPEMFETYYIWDKIEKEEETDTALKGELQYYSSWNKTYAWSGDGATLISADTTKYEAWLRANPYENNPDTGGSREWEYYNGAWHSYTDAGSVTIQEWDMEDTTGLSFSLDGSSAWGSVYPTVEVNKSSTKLTVRIYGQKQINALGSSDAYSDITGLGPNNDVTVNRQAVYAFYGDVRGVSVKEIPDYFLAYCFNMENLGKVEYSASGSVVNRYEGSISISTKKIGKNFLSYSRTLWNGRTSGSVSLEGYYDSATETRNDLEIGNGFMGAVFYQSRTTIVNSITIGMGYAPNITIGDNFFSGNTNVAFAGTVAIGNTYSDSGITKNVYIGDNFLQGSRVSTLTINTTVTGKIRTIGDNFCYNTVIGSVSGLSGVTSIGNNFFKSVTQFNTDLVFPSVKSIGTDFLYGCTSMAGKVELPSVLSVDVGGFMRNCNAFTGPLLVGQSGLVASTTQTNRYALTTNSTTAAMYVTGVTVTGAGRSAILELGDRTTSPYRKLVDGGGETPMIGGTSDPTTSTVGSIGQLYVNITTCDTFQCTAISSGAYTWTKRWVVS